MSGRINVQFEAGTSRHGDYGVNYLISKAPEATLYAECAVPEGASDDYGYFALKEAILKQAKEAGLPLDNLSFWYDGQEEHLEPDAHAECEVKDW